MMKIKTAVFPIAGKGSRFLPATKVFPKEMLPLIDKPLIQYAVEEALASGIDKLVFVIGEKQQPFQDYFYDFDLLIGSREIHFVRQEEPLGLGHAILCARQLVQEDFFTVLLPDDYIHCSKPCIAQLIEVYEKYNGNVVAIQTVQKTEVSNYGIIAGESIKDSSLISIESFIEKPTPAQAPSCLAITGRYLLSSRIFDHLEGQKPGKGNEIQLTDSFTPLLKEVPFYGALLEGQRFDCGSKKGYLAATLKLALERDDAKIEIEKVLQDEGFVRQI